MTFNGRVTLFALATGLSLFSMCSPATAGNTWSSFDRKSYTGAQCQPAYGSQSADFTIFQGYLRNVSDGNRWVSCAVTFDQEGILSSTDSDSATNAGPLYLYVALDYSAVPAGPTYTTPCTLRGTRQSGTTLTVSDSLASAKTASIQTLTFDQTENAVFDGESIGLGFALQVSCRLPPKVALASFKIYEYGGTGNYTYTP